MFLVPESDDPQALEVKRLAVRPGDRIVVRLDHEPSDAEFEDITHGLRRAFDGLEYTPPVIILSPGMEIGVIGPETAGEDVKAPELTVQLGGAPGDEFFRWLQGEVRRRGGGAAVFALWPRSLASC